MRSTCYWWEARKLAEVAGMSGTWSWEVFERRQWRSADNRPSCWWISVSKEFSLLLSACTRSFRRVRKGARACAIRSASDAFSCDSMSDRRLWMSAIGGAASLEWGDTFWVAMVHLGQWNLSFDLLTASKAFLDSPAHPLWSHVRHKPSQKTESWPLLPVRASLITSSQIGHVYTISLEFCLRKETSLW